MKKILFLFSILFITPKAHAFNTLIQVSSAGFGIGAGNIHSLQYTNNITTGSFLACFVGAEDAASSTCTVIVSDDKNGNWTQVPGYSRGTGAGATVRFGTWWYLINSSGSVKPTVTVTAGFSVYETIIIYEYSVPSTTGILFDSSVSSNTTSSISVIHTGTVTVSGNGELVLAGMVQGNVVLTSASTALPFTIQGSQLNGSSNESAIGANDTNAGQNEEAIFTLNTNVNQPISMIVSFKTNVGVPVFVSSVSVHASGATGVTSPTFTDTNTNDLILIGCMNDYGDSNGAFSLATTNSGLTIALATQTVGSLGQSGWYYACTAVGGFSGKTFTCNSNSSGAPTIIVESWSGTACTNATPSLGIGAKAQNTKSTGQPSISTTTTVNNSWVIACGLDAGGNHTVTAGSNQFLAYSLADIGNFKTYWVVHQNAATPTAGTSVTMNVSGITGGDDWNMAGIEILPAPAGSANFISVNKINNGKIYNGTIQ